MGIPRKVSFVHIRIERLLFQCQGAEVGVLGAGIEARAIFLYPWEVAMTEDLGIGIVVQQTAEQDFYTLEVIPMRDAALDCQSTQY